MAAVEVYRFLWLRSFHHPISVRLVCRKDGSALLILERDRWEGWIPAWKIDTEYHGTVIQQVESFRSHVEDSAVWKQPIRQTGGNGLDGAQWITEMA